MVMKYYARAYTELRCRQGPAEKVWRLYIIIIIIIVTAHHDTHLVPLF